MKNQNSKLINLFLKDLRLNSNIVNITSKLICIIKTIFIIFILCLLLKIIYNKFFIIENFDNNINKIKKLTDKWINELVINKDADEAFKLFCSDGNFIGTVSEIKKEGEDIRSYFKYFMKLPGIKIINKKYNISKITESVYSNTAFITWSWDDLDKPINTKLSITFRDKCIYQIHTTSLPEMN